MKTALGVMDENNDPKNIKISMIPEETRTSSDIEVSDFSSEDVHLTVPEELNSKTISYIEREIRNSYEYRAYISYLKNELDLTKCSLLPGLDIKDLKISLEFHHFPLTLFDITEIVGKSMLENLAEGDSVSCFEIAERVTEEHFKGNVGLIPLTKTLHEMAHNGSIYVPLEKVNGDYKQFFQNYKEFISEDKKAKLLDYQVNNDTDEAKGFNYLKLQKNVREYNIEYNHNDDDEDSEGNK